MSFSDSLWAIHRVWLRYFDVFRKNIPYYVVTTFTEPLLYLMAFGFGVGGLIGELDAGGRTLSYRSFVFAGIVGQTVLFLGFFEAAYGGFIRMYYQKIFQAMATTPITLSEVLWGELIWNASKAAVAAEAVVLIGVLFGDFPAIAMLTVMPLCFLGALIFAAFGLAVAAYSKNIEQISYPQYLLIFPMFLFCGVFYPIEQLPQALQTLAWALPLTSLISLLRSLLLDFPFELKTLPILLIWLIALVVLSRRAMTRRLVK